MDFFHKKITWIYCPHEDFQVLLVVKAKDEVIFTAWGRRLCEDSEMCPQGVLEYEDEDPMSAVKGLPRNLIVSFHITSIQETVHRAATMSSEPQQF